MTSRDFSESVSLEIQLDRATATSVEQSLRVEAADLGDARSETTITRDGGKLHVEIGATDLTALRAATNTWLGLLSTAEETVAIVDDGV